MAKRAGKYKTGPENYKTGCIGGIIRMLDFRNNAPKLLLDRRHESSRHASGNQYLSKNYHMQNKSEEKQESLNLSIETEAGNGDLSSTSIRILMLEELPSLHLPEHNLCTELKNPKPELETGYEDTKLLGIHKVHCSNLEVSKNPLSGQSPFQDPLEVFPIDLNFGALLQEFYNNKYKEQICKTDNKDADLFQNHSKLQKALHEVLDPFYKLFVANYDGNLPKPEEFMKASELMGLNKDTFLKFLQDPDSSLLKPMREDPNFLETKTRDIGTLKQRRDISTHNMPHKKNTMSIFRKRNKFNGEDQSHESHNSQQLKKIVLLKPATAIKRSNINVSRSNSNEKATSGFSFREIARRLRHAIGERKREQHLISTDCNVFEIPTVHSVTDQGSNFTERSSQSVTDNNKREGLGNEESKDDCSLREISSPGFIPEEHQEPGLSPSLITLSPPWSPGIELDTTQERTLLMCDTENLPSTTNKSNAEVDSLESNLNPLSLNSQVEEFSCKKEVSNPEGAMHIIDIGGTELVEKQNLVESGTKISVNATDDCEDYKSPKPRLDILEFEKRESAKIINENPDGPSPISILEPPFSDDVASSETTDVDHVFRLHVSPREIQFDEYDDLEIVLRTSNNEIKRITCMEEEQFKHEYILTLLEASGLSKYETWERIQFSEQLLDTSLYYEVETPNGEIPDDLNLLFDCICEVLESIRRRYFSSRPWISSIGHYLHSFPSMEKLVQEVLEGTTCNSDQRIQSTLNQIIKRDMDAGTWMGVGSETEDIKVDVENEILEEILEDMVLELWQLNRSSLPRS